jgi:hypothetical protein
VTGIAVFSPLVDKPEVRWFVDAYRAHYGLVPTQRSFFVYEAVLLVADAIRRGGADTPAAIEAALKGGAMASALGGTYKMDAHNHPKLPLFVVGVREGKAAVIGEE